MLTWLNDAATAVGLVGMSTLSGWFLRSRDLGSGRRLVRFKDREPLTVVLVTSATGQGGVDGVPYRRHTVSLPTLYGAAHVASLASSLGYRKRFDTTVSETVSSALVGDLVLLGGGIKNRLAAEFTDEFNRAFPEHRIVRDLEDGRRVLRIGGWSAAYEPQTDAEGNLTRDLALLVVWRNPFASRARRGIMCTGFTSWGTNAAAAYLSDEALQDRCRRARRERALPHRLSPRRPDFVLVLDVTLANDVVIATKERYFLPLCAPRHSRRPVPVG